MPKKNVANLPSTTGKPSGKGRGNNTSSKPTPKPKK